MSTLNQEKAALKVAEVLKSNESIDGGDLLEMVGYSKNIAKQPGRIFQSKGFQEALKRLGFSIEAADMTVAKILRTGKEENQLRASEQIYKRLGAYAQSPEGGITNNFVFIWQEKKNQGS